MSILRIYAEIEAERGKNADKTLVTGNQTRAQLVAQAAATVEAIVTMDSKNNHIYGHIRVGKDWYTGEEYAAKFLNVDKP